MRRENPFRISQINRKFDSYLTLLYILQSNRLATQSKNSRFLCVSFPTENIAVTWPFQFNLVEKSVEH